MPQDFRALLLETVDSDHLNYRSLNNVTYWPFGRSFIATAHVLSAGVFRQEAISFTFSSVCGRCDQFHAWFERTDGT